MHKHKPRVYKTHQKGNEMDKETSTPTLIEDLGIFTKEGTKTPRRYGSYKCPICFKPFTTLMAAVRMGKSTKCRSCATTLQLTTLNESKSRLYSIWADMRYRCVKPSHALYYRYGGSGITIEDLSWESYEVFREWSLQNGYNSTLSIDRRDNNKGYAPYNCRWVTQEIQTQNTRKIRSTNTSGYRGVDLHKKTGRYRARISVSNTVHSLGYYDTAIEAAKAYDEYVISNKLEHTINFGDTMRLEHKLYKRLLQYSNAKNHQGLHMPIMLTGEAGTSKSQAVEHLAEDLGLCYGYMAGSQQLTKSDLLRLS